MEDLKRAFYEGCLDKHVQQEIQAYSDTAKSSYHRLGSGFIFISEDEQASGTAPYYIKHVEFALDQKERFIDLLGEQRFQDLYRLIMSVDQERHFLVLYLPGESTMKLLEEQLEGEMKAAFADVAFQVSGQKPLITRIYDYAP